MALRKVAATEAQAVSRLTMIGEESIESKPPKT